MSEKLRTIVTIIDNNQLINVELTSEENYPNKNDEYNKLDAIGVLSKLNAEKFILNFQLPYKIDISNKTLNLKNALKYEVEHSVEQVEKYLDTNEILQLIDIVMIDYHKASYGNDEWYRLAKENKVINEEFSDNNSDTTTFYQDGILEAFIGDISVMNNLKSKVQELIGAEKISRIGAEFDYVIGLLMSIYGYYVADMKLLSDLNLALDYINFAKESKHVGWIELLLSDIEQDRKNANIRAARIRAIRRHQNDPKQQYKSFIKNHWLDWQALESSKDRYDGKAAFARDMMDKYHDPTDRTTPQSQAVIERWCREFEKEKTNTHPV